MVTRDTNIVFLTANLAANAAATWGSGNNKPFTFTAQYGGVDNSNTYTWTITSCQVHAYNDTTIENIRISGAAVNTTTIPAALGNGSIYGNYRNLKIGRGIERNRSQY